jgi:cytochrome b561
MASVTDAAPQHDVVLRYTNGAIFLHWVTAALVLIQVAIGFTFHLLLPRGPLRTDLFLWHKTLGATILLLAIVRLIWRLTHKPPPFPDDLPHWERVASVWTHRAFYFLLIALPLTGLAAVSGGADGPTTALKFGLTLPVVPGLSDDTGETFGLVHIGLVVITLLLFVIHVGAALTNQIQRKRVAGRMPPFQAPGDVEVMPAQSSR